MISGDFNSFTAAGVNFMSEDREPTIDPEEELMDIYEVMRLLKISRPTLYRHLKDGAPEKHSKGMGIEINQIPSQRVDGKRFWSKSGYLKLLKEGWSITCPNCKHIIK